MVLRNVTVTLEENLLRDARHLAVDRGQSLSRFVAELIEEKVDGRRVERKAAWEQAKRLMHEGYDFGIRGRITWTRDSLHER